MKNSTPKYSNSIGQNTGTSNTEKNVIPIDVTTPRVHANQNLNSGNRRANGRYSFPSLAVLGKLSPSSRFPPTSVNGSSNGLKNAIKLFNKNIPRPYATMKYPWIRYIRRKNRESVMAKTDQRGIIWMVDLSSQYWIALRTVYDVWFYYYYLVFVWWLFVIIIIISLFLEAAGKQSGGVCMYVLWGCGFVRAQFACVVVI